MDGSGLGAGNGTGNPWSVQAETVIVDVHENIYILFLKLCPLLFYLCPDLASPRLICHIEPELVYF